MDESESNRIETAVRCCVECLKSKGRLRKAKSLQVAYAKTFLANCLQLERWISPYPGCASGCPAEHQTNMVICGCIPQPWDGRYIVWGKGRSVKLGRVVESHEGYWLVMRMSSPKHKDGSKYSYVCFDGRIEYAQRNVSMFKGWTAARTEFWERGGEF